MATAPTNIDPAKALTTRFEAPSRGFADKAAMLQKLPLTQENAEQALIWDTQAKQWLDGVEKECAPVRKKLFEAHRDFVALIRRQTDPVEKFRRVCSAFRANYERQRLAKIAEQRHLDEQRQLEEQKRQQKAEAEHLLAIAAETNDPAALEAAIEVETAPLAPVVSSVDTNAGKVPGSSVTLKKTGRIVDIRAFLLGAMGITKERVFEQMWHANDIDQFRDEDAQRLATELMFSDTGFLVDVVEIKADPAEAGPALKINQSALDDKLNRGIEIPGVEVFEKAITRNLSRN